MLSPQNNYPLARQMAVSDLLRANLAERAAKSGSSIRVKGEGEACIRLPYLGQEVRLALPQGTIEIDHGQTSLSLKEEILILHYLGKAAGVLPTGEWISFAEIPGGKMYYPVFQQRCQVPLARVFGDTPEALPSLAAEVVQAEPWHLGDAGVRIQALPHVALGLALWRKDEEFQAEGIVLYDASVRAALPVEDAVILAETVVWKLVKAGSRELRAGSKA
jgi:hypothetical protein